MLGGLISRQTYVYFLGLYYHTHGGITSANLKFFFPVSVCNSVCNAVCNFASYMVYALSYFVRQWRIVYDVDPLGE